MYIVLTAMLALNVSSDVLDGFRQVHDGIRKTNSDMAGKNEVQFRHLETLYRQNPEKAGKWYEKGIRLRLESQSLVTFIDSLKQAVAIEADGKKGDPSALINLEDLEASSVTMLNPMTNHGEKLHKLIDNYRDYTVSLVEEPERQQAIEKLLSTKLPAQTEPVGIAWEEKMFGGMPAIAAVTLLTKLENDIMLAESEAMSTLITNIDIGDVRVNELNAYVIPQSAIVMRGGKYSADVVLAAVDTTCRPSVFLNGSPLPAGQSHIELTAAAAGSHSYSGFIEVTRGDGVTDRRPFSSSYTVIEPMATVSATMMNVLYSGIDNPLSVSVPGVPMADINVEMKNGTLVRNGNGWIARPGKPGSEAVINVSARMEGKIVPVGSTAFRVRKLPDPSPFLAVKDAQGNTVHYRGTPKRISKRSLMESEGIGAAIDDDILNVSYSVVSFTTESYDAMGNAMPEVSDGARFSSRQKEQFKRLKPGKSFFITNVKAKGPDGITRDISPMQVSLN